MTGVEGRYDGASNCYLPPTGFSNWGQVIKKYGLKFETEGRLMVLGMDDSEQQ